RARMNANETFSRDRRESAMIADSRSVFVRHGKLERVIFRRKLERRRQLEASVHLRAALRIRKKTGPVPILPCGIVEAGRRTRSEKHGECVADAAAAVHLDREIERRLTDRSDEPF